MKNNTGYIILLLTAFAALLMLNTSNIDFGDTRDLSSQGLRDTSDRDRPNIIIIDVDRMTSEHMPCYGYRRNTTPNMCEFGRQNILFQNMISQAGWTASSVASLFTGQYVGTHGLVNHSDSLGEERLTLAESLKDKGYTTAAFPSYPGENTSSPAPLLPRYNLDQGFEKYNGGNLFLKQQKTDVRKWLEGNQERPFFLYIQGFGPHTYANNWTSSIEERYRKKPSETILNLSHDQEAKIVDINLENGSYYVQTENKSVKLEQEDIAYIKSHYDDILYQIDRDFKEIMQLLREEQVHSNSIIILMSNHGELLDSGVFSGSRRFGHGTVWEDDTNVPFMMHVPEGINKSIEEQTELIDVFPTLLDRVGFNVKNSEAERLQGSTLKPLYTEENGYNKDYAFTVDHNQDIYAVRNNTWKLVKYSQGGTELFNLKKDPEEDKDVKDKYPQIASSLDSTLQRHRLMNDMLRSKIYN